MWNVKTKLAFFLISITTEIKGTHTVCTLSLIIWHLLRTINPPPATCEWIELSTVHSFQWAFKLPDLIFQVHFNSKLHWKINIKENSYIWQFQNVFELRITQRTHRVYFILTAMKISSCISNTHKSNTSWEDYTVVNMDILEREKKI